MPFPLILLSFFFYLFNNILSNFDLHFPSFAFSSLFSILKLIKENYFYLIHIDSSYTRYISYCHIIDISIELLLNFLLHNQFQQCERSFLCFNDIQFYQYTNI